MKHIYKNLKNKERKAITNSKKRTYEVFSENNQKP